MLILHWHSSYKRKSSAEQLASSSPGSRANSSNSKVNAVLVRPGSSRPAADHHSREVGLMGDPPVADLQSRGCSHMPIPSCSDSSARQGPSRHSSSSSSQKRSHPLAARLPSSLAGAQKSKAEFGRRCFGVSRSHPVPNPDIVGQQYCITCMLGLLGRSVPRITLLRCSLKICD